MMVPAAVADLAQHALDRLLAQSLLRLRDSRDGGVALNGKI